MKKEELKTILQEVRPYFKERIGQFTHKRISDDWYFHALGFVRDELTYVFGLNIGFFVPKGNSYKYAGMSVTIRANGIAPDIRARYLDFFAKQLAQWSNQSFGRYTSERGDEGLLIMRYFEIEGRTHTEIIDFMRDSIDKLRQIMPAVVRNSALFECVVRAEMPWDETFVEIAQRQLALD